jgi:hypothetical protein
MHRQVILSDDERKLLNLAVGVISLQDLISISTDDEATAKAEETLEDMRIEYDEVWERIGPSGWKPLQEKLQ